MTTTTEDINPMENGVQQSYIEVRDSLEMILQIGVGTELYAEAAHNPHALIQQVLTSLDDAVSNNWDDLMASFWRGVKQDIDLMEGN